MKRALLALEDGKSYPGISMGAEGERGGEAVFNTAMTGYQEILTDPSYTGQIVVMTYPEIGNYGINFEDTESDRPYLEGFVIRHASTIYSNWRAQGSLQGYLAQHGVVGISDIDTRALVRHLREHGALRAVISSEDLSPASLVEKARALPSMVGSDLATQVTCKVSRHLPACGADDMDRYRVVALDFGIKENILRLLTRHGCEVTLVPAQTPAERILDLNPDGIFLSNGPGDPEPLGYAIKTIRDLLGRKPIFGICLGHQLLGLALGGKTYKLKFGHHGGNHPVKNLATGRVEITSQNHGFCVDPESLGKSDIQITHLNLNDSTVEGVRHLSMPAFSVQYHPEAAPGPHDSRYLFHDFCQLMKENQPGNR